MQFAEQVGAAREGLGAQPDLQRQRGTQLGGRARRRDRAPHVPGRRVGPHRAAGRAGRGGVRLHGDDGARAEVDHGVEHGPGRDERVEGVGGGHRRIMPPAGRRNRICQEKLTHYSRSSPGRTAAGHSPRPPAIADSRYVTPATAASHT